MHAALLLAIRPVNPYSILTGVYPTNALQEETALDAVQLCDRAMASGVAMEAGLAPLYAAAMLLLCARQCERGAALGVSGKDGIWLPCVDGTCLLAGCCHLCNSLPFWLLL